MKKLFKNKFLVLVVGILVVALAIGLFVRMGSSQTYTTLGASDYKVGALDSTTGEFTKNAGSFVSSDFHTVEGLTVKLDENADLSYQLYFYDEEETFISASNSFGVTFNGTIPEDAELFKIVVSPVEDDDISTFDIIKYSSNIEVRFYK